MTGRDPDCAIGVADSTAAVRGAGDVDMLFSRATSGVFLNPGIRLSNVIMPDAVFGCVIEAFRGEHSYCINSFFNFPIFGQCFLWDNGHWGSGTGCKIEGSVYRSYQNKTFVTNSHTFSLLFSLPKS
jgi:hypothetical protein